MIRVAFLVSTLCDGDEGQETTAEAAAPQAEDSTYGTRLCKSLFFFNQVPLHQVE